MCLRSAGQAVRDAQKGDRTAAAVMRFQFWVADANSTSIFFPFGKEAQNDVGGKFS